MTTLFSVDVETTSTNPFTGQLLSVGAVAVDYDTLEVNLDDAFYARVEYDPDGLIDPATYEWWTSTNVSTPVFEEAWTAEPRYSSVATAAALSVWACKFSDNVHERVFAANPASFDYAWILKLYSSTDVVQIPFSHRTMCMRNIAFGLEKETEWGQSRGSRMHQPTDPHNALSDATAQAYDLVDLLRVHRGLEVNTAAVMTS